MISIPLTILILMIVLGAFVGALIPLMVGITSVVAAFGLVGVSSHGVAASENIMEVVLLVGLAVGVDYSLFYMRREREERAAGRSERAALEAAAATSGHAVLVSGMTVLIAMAGMFLSGDKTFMSFSIGAMLVVAVAMIGSLTVLPAVLSKLGDRVEKGRIPFVGRLRRGAEKPQHVGRDHRPRPPPPARLGAGRRSGARRPGRCRRSSSTPPRPAWRASRRPRWSRSSTSSRRSRARPSQPPSRSRPTTSRPRRCRRRSPSSSRRRSPAARCTGRSRSRSTVTTRSPRSTSRSTATAPTTPRSPRSRPCATICSRRPSARSTAWSTR